MFAPEEQQMEICLLKTDLQEIENDLVVQRSTLPALDAENELQCRETMAALRVARNLNVDIERLKLENVRLLAKRMQIKKECETAAEKVEHTRCIRAQLNEELCAVEGEEETLVRSYEDSLREKSERFRKARIFYNESELSAEMEAAAAAGAALAARAAARERAVGLLRQELEALRPAVPDDILHIVEKPLLLEKLNQLTEQLENLEKRKNNLVARKKNNSSLSKKLEHF